MAESLSCHPSRRRMDSSDLDHRLTHGSNSISIGSAVFAYTAAMTPNAIRWDEQPQKLPLPLEDLDPI